MTLEINRRNFLQALIAAGASFALPAKATKAQIDQVWAEAQANPWFFEVNENGTLIDADIPEPQVWADVFDITTSETSDIQSIIREIQACPPLSSFMDRALDKEIESLEEDFDNEEPELTKEQKALQKKIATLKEFREEYEEPWQYWIELEGKSGVAKFNELIEDWLTDPIDWMQSDFFPVRSGPQGAALGFFENQSYELLDAIGVVIVDGEHPGSSYYAAELSQDIEKANATAERLGLPFRFKKPDEHPVLASLPPSLPPRPSKLAIAINGPDDLEELQRIDAVIAASGVLIGPNALPADALPVFNEFESGLPKVSGTFAGMARLSVLSTLRSRINAFVLIKGRSPTSAEIQRLWDAT